MSDPCEICRRIERLSGSRYLIAELSSGYAVIGDNQTYEGYSIFLSKTCVPELHDLTPDVRSRFLEEMALVAEAVFRAFSPRKLNYELLGNSVPHLHWHLFPRYANDPNPAWPIWNNETFAAAKPERDPARIAVLRDRVRAQLKLLLVQRPPAKTQ